MTNEMDELLASLEAVRAERYPEISPDLVRAILEVEGSLVGDPAAAMREVQELVEQSLREASADA